MPHASDQRGQFHCVHMELSSLYCVDKESMEDIRTRQELRHKLLLVSREACVNSFY